MIDVQAVAALLPTYDLVTAIVTLGVVGFALNWHFLPRMRDFMAWAAFFCLVSLTLYSYILVMP